MPFLQVKPSTLKDKKYTAVFYDDDKKKLKTIHFGAVGYDDFTIHKDKDRKQRYIDRHRKNENWNNPMMAGTLSRFILWEKPSFEASKKYYMQKFGYKEL